jgi:methionine synthase II (cobalamin-independent)
VPSSEEIYEVTPADLARKLRQGLDLIQEKAQARGVNITSQELAARSLITPNCGLGPTTVEVAERALDVLVETGEILKDSNV